MYRHISVSGVSYHNGVSTLDVVAYSSPGVVIDAYKWESSCHSFEELYSKYARKAIKYLRATYGITELRQPTLHFCSDRCGYCQMK